MLGVPGLGEMTDDFVDEELFVFIVLSLGRLGQKSVPLCYVAVHTDGRVISETRYLSCTASTNGILFALLEYDHSTIPCTK